MILPPPNVTGSLHLGHALTATLQDALARWHRMRGFQVVWVPGLDHAGIATQQVVELQLAREGRPSRREMGREAFVRQVWDWKARYGSRINAQMRRLGALLDWDREVFTLDAPRSAAVTHAFCELARRGLVYRGTRLVNWSPRLQTALSDIEVDALEVRGPTHLPLGAGGESVQFGLLHRLRYPLEGAPPPGSPDALVVATTRPETMFGDVAVAVHPEDAELAPLVGRHVVQPLTGRRLRVVSDAELVDPTLGSRCVKVTPAHDARDFACAQRHALPAPNILTDDGALNELAGSLAGAHRLSARRRVVDALRAVGAYAGSEPHASVLPVCSRSGDIVEPRLKPQWYVRCAPLAARAAAMERSGGLRIGPDAAHRDEWHRWLSRIEDWCVSRQLWWGHPVPAFSLEPASPADASALAAQAEPLLAVGALHRDADSGRLWVVAEDEAAARALCQQLLRGVRCALRPDADVLDTWFSSALLPLSSFGWPDAAAWRASGGAQCYPLSLMETGGDIIFFWVARMAMLCGELADAGGAMGTRGAPPFREVFLHPLIRDAEGRKMSKSRGNVVDPLEVIEGCALPQLQTRVRESNLPVAERERALAALAREFPQGFPECGADALRLTLAHYMAQTRAINLDVQRIVATRHLCNKAWQAARFVLRAQQPEQQQQQQQRDEEAGGAGALTAVRWWRSRLARAVRVVAAAYTARDFGAAATATRDTLLSEFCDVFLEFAKQNLRAPPESGVPAETRAALRQGLDVWLRLAHPLMPFLTDELHAALRGAPRSAAAPSLAESHPFPDAAGEGLREDAAAEQALDVVLAVVRAYRSLRANFSAHFSPESRDPLFITAAASAASSAASASAGPLRQIIAPHLPQLRFHCRGAAPQIIEGGVPALPPATLQLPLACGLVAAVQLRAGAALARDLERAERRLTQTRRSREQLAAAVAAPDFAAKADAEAQARSAARLAQLEEEEAAAAASLHHLQAARAYFGGAAAP
jgi:valyl-tRNA synthetase